MTTLKEKHPQLFEMFSDELIEFVLSEKTAQQIANICIENKVTDKEKVEGIAFRATYVLFEKLPKENLAMTIEEGLEIEKEKAESIAKKIDEIILSKNPSSLEKDQKEEVKEEEKKAKPTPQPFDKDAYREPID